MPFFDTSDATRLFYADASGQAAAPFVLVHAWP